MRVRTGLPLEESGWVPGSYEHALAQLNVIQAELARSAPEKLSLYADRYRWEFIPTAGGTFSDSGSALCH